MAASSRDLDLVFYAPTVHVGGGLVLLKQLLAAIPTPARAVLILDSRLPVKLLADVRERGFADVVITGHGLANRFSAEWTLAKTSRRAAASFLFGNLPSLLPLKSPAFIYFHNSLIFEDLRRLSVPLRFKLTHWIKRSWLRLFIGRTDVLFVQTPTMRRQLASALPLGQKIEIRPFYAQLPLSPRTKTLDFVYIASGDPHKNHDRLLKTWEYLANRGLYPSLTLTVNSELFPKLASEIDAAVLRANLKITNHSVVADVPALYGVARCLIYPSLNESFGLPLLEALDAGLDILAADRPYVFDICQPSGIFDPTSTEDVSSAVERYMKTPAEKPRRAIKTFSAADVIQRCLLHSMVDSRS